MFELAVRVLELLQDRRTLFADSGIDPLGELVDELSDPMQVEALVNLFQVKFALRGPIGRLFRLLSRATVLRQLLLLIGDPKRTPVAIGDLVEVVMELSDDDVDGTVTAPEFLDKPIYLRRVMSELPGRDFARWKPTPRFIRKAIDASDPEIRELGLQLNHPCWSDPGLARDYLVPMAGDPDERIRKLALELLGERHPQMFQDAIRDTLLSRKMGDRTHAELRFLMRIFLDTSDDAAPFLRSLIDTKGWFGGSAREFAKMAAAVLIQAGDEEVRKKIETAQKSFLTAPELKRAYEQILERFGPLPAHQAPSVEEER